MYFNWIVSYRVEKMPLRSSVLLLLAGQNHFSGCYSSFPSHCATFIAVPCSCLQHRTLIVTSGSSWAVRFTPPPARTTQQRTQPLSSLFTRDSWRRRAQPAGQGAQTAARGKRYLGPQPLLRRRTMPLKTTMTLKARGWLSRVTG